MIKKYISSLPLIRKLFIRCLKMTSFDFSITNPWTRDILFLNSYRHKGYWYFGRSRESKTMDLFQKNITKGDVVIEIGGHIGYVTQYLSFLVGNEGRVIVFEPGTNNIPYIEKNTSNKKNVYLEKLAISNQEGIATFYEENITGQTNSLLNNYKGAEAGARLSGSKLEVVATKVNLMPLDNYLINKNLEVNFIKMDIEGGELNALYGMQDTLKKIKRMMIEVTENQREVSEILIRNNFSISDEDGNTYREIPINFYGNIFATKISN